MHLPLLLRPLHPLPLLPQVVAQVLCSLLPRVQLCAETLYERLLCGAPGGPPTAGPHEGGTVWLPSTRRLYALVAACMASSEPVLLVGDTGTGKTTVCQLYAQAAAQALHIINCHQHTEAADFVGGLRPTRGRTLQLEALRGRVAALEAEAASARAARASGPGAPADGGAGREGGSGAAPMDCDCAPEEEDEAALAGRLGERAEECRALLAAALAPPAEGAGATEAAAARLRAALHEAEALADELRAAAALFVWVDGPLVTAMRRGDLLLIDEISLAEDAVRHPHHTSRVLKSSAGSVRWVVR